MRKFLSLLLPLALHSLPSIAAENVVLTPKNTVVIRGEIDGGNVTVAQLRLVGLVAQRGLAKYPIYLVLDSPGGSITAGNMFIQFAKTIPNLHTISIFAASMASAIAEQLPGQRLVTEDGTMMFHMAAAGIEGTVETGSLESRLYWIKRQVQALESANANRMQTSIVDYKAAIRQELWLYSDDAVKYRAADKVVTIVCTAALIVKTTKLTISSFFGTASYEFSACPLFRVPLVSSDAKVQYSYGADSLNKPKAPKGDK